MRRNLRLAYSNESRIIFSTYQSSSPDYVEVCPEEVPLNEVDKADWSSVRELREGSREIAEECEEILVVKITPEVCWY